MAELYGTRIELHGVGGFCGHVDAQLGCSIANNSYYEDTGGGRRMMEAISRSACSTRPRLSTVS
jgi:hypothetical protein